MSWAAAISAGSSLLGGLLGQNAQAESNRQMRYAARENIANQKEFAKMGIRWKVEDAQKAGLHPLSALGANTASFSPVSVGSTPEDGMAQGIANMGQDISRSMMAKATPEERTLSNLQVQNAQADLDGKLIDNQIRASQLQKMNSPVQVPPPLPSAMGYSVPGQGNSAVRVNPAQLTASDAADLSKEAGIVNDYTLALTPSGGYIPVPSKDIKERIEDSAVMEWPWAIRNYILGSRHQGVPEGYDWNPLTLQYESGFKKRWYGKPVKDYIKNPFKKSYWNHSR